VPPTHCALPTAVDQRSFLIRVGLGHIPASIEEIRHEIGDWLDDNQPILQRSQADELVLSLTVVAADLWLSLLLAMACVTQTGYQPHWIETRPTADSRRRRRAK
jgi:hypothetical protein